MDQENLTSEQLADIETLPLHEAAGKILGKEFPDVATAAKAMKDTFGYVAKAGEGIKILETVMADKGFKTQQEATKYINDTLAAVGAGPKPAPANEQQPKIDPSEFVSKKDFEARNFYGDHPEYKDHAGFVETFVKANPDKTRDEVVAFDAIKVSKQKSILHSNPKIGAAGSKIDEARESAKSGNQSQADQQATRGVMDAFEL
jgi:hypothetical protein